MRQEVLTNIDYNDLDNIYRPLNDLGMDDARLYDVFKGLVDKNIVIYLPDERMGINLDVLTKLDNTSNVAHPVFKDMRRCLALFDLMRQDYIVFLYFINGDIVDIFRRIDMMRFSERDVMDLIMSKLEEYYLIEYVGLRETPGRENRGYILNDYYLRGTKNILEQTIYYDNTYTFRHQ